MGKQNCKDIRYSINCTKLIYCSNTTVNQNDSNKTFTSTNQGNKRVSEKRMVLDLKKKVFPIRHVHLIVSKQCKTSWGDIKMT